MFLAAAVITVALVTQNQTPLRATSHDNASRQAALTAGDWLEVRGEQRGFLQVYDHRRERPGYVRPSAVRTYPLEEASSGRLAPVVEFLRDAPGSESLGIGYVALFLKVAPADAIGPEAFDALGTMAERLAARASARVAKSGDESTAHEIEVAESYGVHFLSVEQDGATRLCYDGEAFRRVLALRAPGRMRLHAALGLTDPRCVDPAAGTSARLAVAEWRADVLGRVDPSALPDVSAGEVARLRLRRSVVDEQLAYFAARAGDFMKAKGAADAARHELALTDRGLLADEDLSSYDEAAMRGSAVRWAVEPAVSAEATFDVAVAPGTEGKTCVHVSPRGASSPVFEHCTYGLVWPSSVRVLPRGAGVVVAVQPLEGWSELHVLRHKADGWSAEVLPPALVDPELGYAELAGVAPDAQRLLVVREYRASGPLGAPHTLAPWTKRTFQVVSLADLHIEREASTLAGIPKGDRWETAEFKQWSLALR